MRTHLVLVLAALMIGLGPACGSSLGGSDGSGGGGGSGGSGGGGGSTGTGGTGGTGGSGGSAQTCSPPCAAADSICVASGVAGGVVVRVDDAGTCPSGYHPTGIGSCTQDLAYACMTIPAGCSGTVNCTCASSLCAGRMCDGLADGVLACVDLVP
jgi:hypothetical protein